MSLYDSTDQERGGNPANIGQFSGHKNSGPEASMQLVAPVTVAALRTKIKKAEAARTKADNQVKELTVDAVRLLAAERFPEATEVEFHKEYNEDQFSLFRANDEDGDIIWASFDPSTHRTNTKATDKQLQLNMNGLMAKVGVDAPRFLPRINDMVGETVVFRF
jgi:hypothetical protein